MQPAAEDVQFECIPYTLQAALNFSQLGVVVYRLSLCKYTNSPQDNFITAFLKLICLRPFYIVRN